MRMPLVLTGVLVLGLGGFSAEAAPIIVNGGFEAVPGPYPWFSTMNAANTPGWTIVTASDFPIITSNAGCGGTYGAGNAGCNFGVLGGGETAGAGSISQTLTGFVVGNSYMLDWLQSSEYVASDTVKVEIIGAATLSQSFQSSPYHGSILWDNWQAKTFPFVADATSLTFLFEGGGSSYSACVSGTDSCDPGVDAVTLVDAGTPIPEPITLLLVGSGLVGVARRRRSVS